MNISNTNPLQFASRIRFVDKQKFESLPLEQGLCVLDNDRDNINVGKIIYSKDIGFCTAGGLTDGDECLLYHFNPAYNLTDLITSLNDKISTFLKDKRLIRGLVIGGYQEGFWSPILKNKILALLQDVFHLPVSVLWGQPASSTKTHIAHIPKTQTEPDTWVVTTSKPILSLDDLKATFTVRQLQPEDEVEIAGKLYSPAEVNSP